MCLNVCFMWTSSVLCAKVEERLRNAHLHFIGKAEGGDGILSLDIHWPTGSWSLLFLLLPLLLLLQERKCRIKNWTYKPASPLFGVLSCSWVPVLCSLARLPEALLWRPASSRGYTHDCLCCGEQGFLIWGSVFGGHC